MIHRGPQPQDGQPCRHMVTLVSAYADGALRGLSGWYTRLHIQGCPRCRAALESLRALKQRLTALKSRPSTPEPLLTAERWSRIDAALAEEEKQGADSA